MKMPVPVVAEGTGSVRQRHAVSPASCHRLPTFLTEVGLLRSPSSIC